MPSAVGRQPTLAAELGELQKRIASTALPRSIPEIGIYPGAYEDQGEPFLGEMSPPSDALALRFRKFTRKRRAF